MTYVSSNASFSFHFFEIWKRSLTVWMFSISFPYSFNFFPLHWKKVQDKGQGAPCREKPLDKSGLEPAAPNRLADRNPYSLNVFNFFPVPFGTKPLPWFVFRYLSWSVSFFLLWFSIWGRGTQLSRNVMGKKWNKIVGLKRIFCFLSCLNCLLSWDKSSHFPFQKISPSLFRLFRMARAVRRVIENLRQVKWSNPAQSNY